MAFTFDLYNHRRVVASGAELCAKALLLATYKQYSDVVLDVYHILIFGGVVTRFWFGHME